MVLSDYDFDFDICMIESNVFDCAYNQFGKSILIPLARVLAKFFHGDNIDHLNRFYPDGNNHRYVESKNIIAESHVFYHILIFSIIFSILCLLDKIIAKKIATKVFNIKDKIDLRRFKECFWQCSYYLPISIYGYYVALSKSYFYDTSDCWEPPFPHQEVELDVYYLYTIQLGWYLHCSVFTLCFDRKLRDFYVMFIHHIAALLLLYSPLATGHYRVGVLVMISIDICDVFLHILKMIRFIDNAAEKGINDYFLLLGYVFLVVTWFTFRLSMFFLKAIIPASFEALFIGGWANADYWGYYNLLLGLMFFLQVYWFYCILQIGYKYVRFGDQLDDVRDVSNANEIKKERLRKKQLRQTTRNINKKKKH
eukprot:TRINITY_DN10874_c0_g1_i1.p1 TRINITY_DN10874_c0_g1~~TRINITY_DN10874_c0_g1_i1.p1  ORF type:complete len:367 (+),score=44.40 TRINITY_DN10874_c0_g1_i1:72-1172(+)